MRLTPHFTVNEFACPDGAPYPADWIAERLVPLCAALEVIRARVGGPIRVLSGYRTPAYNARIGGARHSQHMVGRAADIVTSACSVDVLAALLPALIRAGEIPPGGVGRYRGFVHYDQRGRLLLWAGQRAAPTIVHPPAG